MSEQLLAVEEGALPSRALLYCSDTRSTFMCWTNTEKKKPGWRQTLLTKSCLQSICTTYTAALSGASIHLYLMNFDPWGMPITKGMWQQGTSKASEGVSVLSLTHSWLGTTLAAVIQLIFLAAIAFNWSHSGPLPWPSADERPHSLLHYPLRSQDCWQWRCETTVESYYRLHNWNI